MDSKKYIKEYKEITNHGLAYNVLCSYGDGVYLYDSNGNRYLDFSSGWGVANYGYNNSYITEGIKQQLNKNIYSPPWIATEESIKLARELLQITGLDSYKCIRATGGADANETALRIALSNKKGRIISFKYSYHGNSSTTIQLSDNTKFGKNIISSDDQFQLHPPYPFRDSSSSLEHSINSLKKIIKNNPISAMIFEPIIGGGGVIEFPEDYLRDIQEICLKNNILIILDEVVTGFGRTGQNFAFHGLPIVPDILTLAKGMSGGYAAIGAVLCRNQLVRKFNKSYSDISSSFAWTPLACVASMLCIDFLNSKIRLNTVINNGKYLKENIEKIFRRYLEKYFGEIRGRGMIIGVELVKSPVSREENYSLGQKLVIKFKNNGLFIATCWNSHILSFLPPLIIDRREIDEGLNRIEDTVKNLS